MPSKHRVSIAGIIAIVASLLLFAGCGSNSTPGTTAQAQGKLYVVVPFLSPSNNGAILRLDNPSVLSGNVSPAATITGNLTRLGAFGGVALDKAADRLFVLTSTSSSTSAILVFDHVSTRAGNTAPDRVIEGSATGLVGTGVLAVDSARDILYAEANSDASGHVDIFTFRNASALSGNVAPSTILQIDPAGVAAVDLVLDESTDRLFALINNQSINVFDHASTLTSGIMNPDRVITGANTGMLGAFHMTMDNAGRLLVTNGIPKGILIFANAAAANGDVSPVATITGSETGLNISGPQSIAVVTGPGASAGGDLYVNVEFGNVLVFKNIATANGNVAPDHMLSIASNGTADLSLVSDASR